MTRREFLRRIEQRGLNPRAVAAHLKFDGVYGSLLGLGETGSGHPNLYTNHDLRLLLAFRYINDFTGQSMGGHRGHNAACTRREAADLLATRDKGYVVMSEGSVSWRSSIDASVFVGGAVVFPCGFLTTEQVSG